MKAVLDWLEESKSFDLVSDIYDLYRPSYPELLIDKIIEKSKVNGSSKILEIGAGSGKATEQFVNRDLNIHCIEQGPNLVKKGLDKFKNCHHVSYDCCTFQEWNIEEEAYDLVISAQAFHWVPKPKGYKKLAKTLKTNGQMMIFWNKYINNGQGVSADLSKLLKEYKVLNMLNDQELKTFKNRTYDGIYTTDLFKDIEIYEYPWELEYTYDEFINFLSTTSGYISLESEEKQVLNLRLMELFSEEDYKITFYYNSILFSGRKC